ncbi:chemotaxis protein CheW [Mesobacillus zeae]|uniref:Chemotaxis protein CheW n=1 Tax=Mesobacillus zeae TaxID=1917180 RepID=A0A398BKW5_9BACI|nr:chemotaxis protein CheW [Mesobacillus zeae]RID88013.1 chemotaxis protein CheW [Mesobacillus zeae]
MTEALLPDVKFIVFQLTDKEYAIPVSEVKSIEKVQHITRVPHALPFVQGVINLRGVVTPIIDLRKRFGLEVKDYDDTTRIIIVAAEDKEVGLIVDAANDVIDLSADSIEPPPEIVGSHAADYISGVAKLDNRLLVLIDLENILGEGEN